MSSCNHVWLEQGTLQVDVMVGQSLVDGSQDLLSNVLAALQVMVTIRKNLRLNNGDDAVLQGSDRRSQEGSLQGGKKKEWQWVYIVCNLCVHFFIFRWYDSRCLI